MRISASQTVGVMHLPRLLANIRRNHPALTIELSLTDKVDDLLQRHADVAIRMVEPVQKALIAHHIGAVRLGFQVHRDYLDRRGVPKTLADLRHHDLIGFDIETEFIRAAMRHVPHVDRSIFAFRVDSDVAQFMALQAACGIGICQTAVARHDPALVRILDKELDLPLPIWIVMHEDLRRDMRYRAVFDALVAGMQCVTSS